MAEWEVCNAQRITFLLALAFALAAPFNGPCLRQ